MTSEKDRQKAERLREAARSQTYHEDYVNLLHAAALIENGQRDEAREILRERGFLGYLSDW